MVSSMEDASLDELEAVAEVWKGVSNRSRIAILAGLSEGENLPTIADELGMTRGGMQKHVERLVDSELIYRPEDPAEPYGLTPLGEYVLKIVSVHFVEMNSALKTLNESERDAQDIGPQELLELVEAVGDREKARHTWKWQQVWDDVEDMLDS